MTFRDGAMVALRDGAIVTFRDGAMVALRDGAIVAAVAFGTSSTDCIDGALDVDRLEAPFDAAALRPTVPRFNLCDHRGLATLAAASALIAQR